MGLILGACRRDAPTEQILDVAAASRSHLPSAAPQQTSATCRECHAEVFAAWSGTDHANANQLIASAELEAAFAAPQDNVAGETTYRMEVRADGHHVVVGAGTAHETDYRVHSVLGYHPSRQMLVETEEGRLQPVELTWDVEREEWFGVFGDEVRRPGEWGHWAGRGMNWNSMCAQCHMTGYQKNYDAATDHYASSWVEQGVSCIQCHGPTPPDHGQPNAKPWRMERTASEQTCATCHARAEALTPEYEPGSDYHDHFRLTLPTEAATFWPDGQQRDEVFNWTSVKLSRMHHAGVSCMDCHDPHTSQTILPVENNALCMQCHDNPGRTMAATGVTAPIINPTAHSRHSAGSTGNQCVSCHMPTTNYMQRSPRHDHGWLKPDPLMTKELGIPNACNRCHTDQSVDWAVAQADAWFGDKLDSRQRQRARAVAAAQAGAVDARRVLLELLENEDIPAWRATYWDLLARTPGEPTAAVRQLAEAALTDTDPLVRAAATRFLTGDPQSASAIEAMLSDESRLVRFDAAWARPRAAARNPRWAAEFSAYLDLALDQPTGQLRQGQYLANLGRLNEAAAFTQRAAEWDRYSAGIHVVHAQVLQAVGDARGAANSFYRAAQLAPDDGDAMFRAGLAYAEAGMMAEAENALQQAVQRTPSLDRAWYNLGLLQIQRADTAAGLKSLARAEEIAPHVPDYPYAAATVYWQQGDRAAARAAAQRALAADPNHQPARELLR